MKTKRLAGLTLAMLAMMFLLGSIITPTVFGDQADINIYSQDDYAKEVDMDESITYFWGIFNSGLNSHVVIVETDSTDFGWTAEPTTTYFELEPDEFMTIELVVTAPDSRDHPTQLIGVSVNITDLATGNSWDEPLDQTTSEITGGAYIPPTKALGFIPNFFVDMGVDALDNEWGVFIISILFWLLIGAIIYFVMDPFVKRLTRSTTTEIDDKVLAIVKGPVFWLIVVYGVISSLGVLDFPWSVVNLLQLMFSILVIIFGCWMAYKIFSDVLLIWGKSYSEKTETSLDDVMLPLFEKLGMVVIFIVAMILLLNLFGIDVTMLLAGMGVLGLVIAFAAQDTLGNFISGMFLLTDRPFKIGDLVLMENGDYCRVEHIGMRSTKLYNTFDHDVIILPNSKIANEKVINLTEPDNKMKVKVTIGVDYKADIHKAKQIMLDVANDHQEVIEDDDRKPFVRLVDFGDSAINLKLYTWVFHLDDQWRVGGEMREEIFKRFKEAEIDIPFPQRVVHMETYSDNKPSISG